MRLLVIADEAYFAKRAEMLRRGWEAEEERRRAVMRRLRARLRARGAAKRVASELGVSRSTLSCILSGRRAPTPLMMRKLGGGR